MLVSTGEAYTVRANVTVAPVTTTIRVVAVEVAIGKRQGLPKRGVIDCDALVTTSKAILSERAGALSKAKREQLDAALAFALGLEIDYARTVSRLRRRSRLKHVFR
ncbi:MAG: type II toxin-antitoxin system PemK/MazF family toxin [Myxococcota bacterium]